MNNTNYYHSVSVSSVYSYLKHRNREKNQYKVNTRNFCKIVLVLIFDKINSIKTIYYIISFPLILFLITIYYTHLINFKLLFITTIILNI